MKKKFQSALFSPPGRWTGNNFLFKDGLNEGYVGTVALSSEQGKSRDGSNNALNGRKFGLKRDT